jgi:hypothetical protein
MVRADLQSSFISGDDVTGPVAGCVSSNLLCKTAPPAR